MKMSPSANDNPLEEEQNDEVACRDVVQEVVIVLSDSDSDDGTNGQYDGYELLPQDPTEEDARLTMDENEEETNDVERQSQDQHETNSECAIPPTIVVNDITMDQERIANIKAAMAGFALPAASIPAWASVVPEDQWMNRLMNLMQSQPINRHEAIDETTKRIQ